MKWLVFGAAVIVCLAVLQAVGLWRSARVVDGLVVRLNSPPPNLSVELPEAVRRYAERAGADGSVRQVRFTQDTEMELKPGEGWQPFAARQWVDTSRAGFVWLAEQRMLGLPIVRVVDSYTKDKGLLVAWLLGSIPVARAEGAEADRAEAMRYLAELPWAPDAMLRNGDLAWQVLGPTQWQVSLNGATVDMHLNADGDIAEITAKDRPAKEGNVMILRDWRGIFRDYADFGGRRIPMSAEVGYVFDEITKPYFKGRITSYTME
ncbi:DUF6544 family protein [Thalassovita sp.]|uniref:DUF6544 family protein n=1 Tax=Thalassovita sp. TaxID=1979401 RepID=UPI0029DE6D47|nr:DUF6544 family protein [Thalassovita sp.]